MRPTFHILNSEFTVYFIIHVRKSKYIVLQDYIIKIMFIMYDKLFISFNVTLPMLFHESYKLEHR